MENKDTMKRNVFFAISKIKYLSILLIFSLFLTNMTGCGAFIRYLLEDETENTGMEYVSDTYDDVVNYNSLFDTEGVRPKQVQLKGDGTDTVTVLVYMNGSNLESDDGQATTDLAEMVKAGDSDQVNVLVQTMGTSKWKRYGIASNRSQIYEVGGDGLTLVKDDLGQLDATAASSLSSFVSWGAANYPADRYILIFWDHGAGPVYGFGYDEFQDADATLTLDEMQTALKEAGVFFDFIGMDCCIMSALETCCALYDYCDYTILSEDFESGLGWYYSDWLKALYRNSSIPTTTLGKMICDSMVMANQDDGEESAILALIDESVMKVLFTAWIDFAYANQDALKDTNFSREVVNTGRGNPRFFSDWFESSDDAYSMEDYYITDIMTVASTIESEESEALASALSAALVYVAAGDNDAGMTGLAVTIPYGDSDFYEELVRIFTNCGFDQTYIAWLGNFADVTYSSEDEFDWESWDSDWSGWDDYEDTYDWDSWYYYDDSSYDDYDWYDDSWDYLWGDSYDEWYNWYNDDSFWSDDSWYVDDSDYWSDYWSDDWYSDDSWFDDSYYDYNW